MRQIIVATGLFLLATTGLYAQNTAIHYTSRYSISIAPASFAWSTLNLGLELRLTDRASLLGQGFFGTRNLLLWEMLEGNYLNYGGRLECRGYLTQNASQQEGSLWGPYFSGWIQGSAAEVTATLQREQYTIVSSQSLTPGISAGWKFPLNRKWTNLTFDVSVGGGYRFGEVEGRYAQQSRSILFKDNGLVPTVGFRIAYAPGVTKSGPGKPKSPEIVFHDQYTPKKRKAIEKALKAKHMFFGRADGVFGEDTIQAIKLFQQKNGLKVDGKAGKATLERLGV